MLKIDRNSILKVSEAAEKLDLTSHRLIDAIRSGELRARKINKIYYVTGTGLLEFFNRKERQP